MREGQKKGFARRLRAQMTDAERKLWQRLRGHQLGGFGFRRQHPVGRYVVDFVCLERQLIVELDGGQHADASSDVCRDAWLVTQGYRVLRFWNHEVLVRTDAVLSAILDALETDGPHPNPPPQAGEGA